MRRSGTGSGGGLGSNKLVRPGYRVGVGAKSINKDYPGSVGTSRGNKVMRKGEPLPNVRPDVYGGKSFRPAPLGNAVAAATVCRVGGSRVIRASGSQHGLTTRANSKGRSID